MSYHLQRHLSKKRQKKIVDHLMGVAAVLHPLTAVPQVYTIYTTHNVSGVSLSTWLGFMTLGLVFLAYGIYHKLKPYILTQVLWFAIDFLVVLGIFLFK